MSNEARRRGPPATTTESEGTGSGVEREEGGKEEIGVLDVVKAIAPLLVIIGLALGMLVLGYMFVPEILTTPSFQWSHSPISATPSPPPSPPPPPAAEETCKAISGSKALITALKDFSEWKELGSALGIPHAHLQTIEKDNEEVELRKRAMLRAWYSRETQERGGACWDDLVDALAGLGERFLAQEIARANELQI